MTCPIPPIPPARGEPTGASTDGCEEEPDDGQAIVALHRALVAEINAALDVDADLSEALLPAAHARLVFSLDQYLSVESDLREFLDKVQELENSRDEVTSAPERSAQSTQTADDKVDMHQSATEAVPLGYEPNPYVFSKRNPYPVDDEVDPFPTFDDEVDPLPTLEELGLGGGVRDFSDHEMAGEDFSSRDLRLANFEAANLVQANFTRARLAGANFRGANLLRANFRGADLTHAVLLSANLAGCDLSLADLREAQVDVQDLEGAKFDRTTKWSPALQRSLSQKAIHQVAPGVFEVTARPEDAGAPARSR